MARRPAQGAEADDDDICRRLGVRVRALRVARGWSQYRLAEVCGLHYNYVGSIERGQVNVGLATLGKLMDGLGVGVRELLES